MFCRIGERFFAFFENQQVTTLTVIWARQLSALSRSWGRSQKERKKTDNPKRGGKGPHLHEQDFGRTIRGTGGALLLLTRDTTGSQRGAR